MLSISFFNTCTSLFTSFITSLYSRTPFPNTLHKFRNSFGSEENQYKHSNQKYFLETHPLQNKITVYILLNFKLKKTNH